MFDNGDNAGFIACFAERLSSTTRVEFFGHDAIAGWNARENIGVNSRIAVLDVVEEKPVFTAEVSVTGDGFNGGSTFAVAVSDQLITRLTIRG